MRELPLPASVRVHDVDVTVAILVAREDEFASVGQPSRPSGFAATDDAQAAAVAVYDVDRTFGRVEGELASFVSLRDLASVARPALPP